MDPSHKAELKQQIIAAFARATDEDRLNTYIDIINNPPMSDADKYSRETIINLVALKYPKILTDYHQMPKPVDDFVDAPGDIAVFQEFRKPGGRRRRSRRSATAHKSSSSRHRRSSKKSGNKRKQRRHRRASRRSH